MNRKQRRRAAKATGNPAWKKGSAVQDPTKLYAVMSKFKGAMVGVEEELTAHAARLAKSTENHERLERERAARGEQ